jgi:uncharacterized oligopeptide transporter (OPT) family protein
MALPSLTDEQVRTWTRAQKDRWWLDTVYKGDSPQLTLRSAATGFFLGGILSATNLYVGAKTGWTLGVGLTSVILAFAMFRVMSRMGAKDMTLLENNAMQSVATAAGYMTGPLISGMAAFMWIEDRPLPWWQLMGFNVVLSVLGVLVAFPMKRRFINDEQQPFPEGRAAGVVMDTLYSSDPSVGMFKARVLAWAAGVAGVLKLFSSENTMKWLQEKVLGLKATFQLHEDLGEYYYRLVEKGWLPMPRLPGIADVRPLGLSPVLDLAMFGAGGLMGVRTALGLLVGMFLNFFVLVPWMVVRGEIKPSKVVNGVEIFSRTHVLNTWALWWGVALMVTASMVSLFSKPQVFTEAFKGLLKKKSDAASEEDVLGHIELPLWISWVFIPVVGAVSVWMGWAWFGVEPLMGASALVLILFLSLIAASSTALTSITPSGSLSKIPQFLYGALRPAHPATNLMTAVMAVEVSSNASNLLMDIKPGYMLGAKPRQQAVGHVVGIFAGALFSTPLFFILFMSGRKEGQSLQEAMTTGQFSFPSAMQWKGISDLIKNGFHSLPASAQWSMALAVLAALVLELGRTGILSGASIRKWARPLSALLLAGGVFGPWVDGAAARDLPGALQPEGWVCLAAVTGVLFGNATVQRVSAVLAAQFALVFAVRLGSGSVVAGPSHLAWGWVLALVASGFALWTTFLGDNADGRGWLSPLAVGLGVVIPADSTLAMAAGAFFFQWMHKRHADKPGTPGHTLWIETHEPICAGLIAGAALLGIVDVLVKVFLLDK